VNGLAAAWSGSEQGAAVLAIVGLCAIVHALAYHAADGALRVQRVMMRRGGDLVALAGVIAVADVLIS
jgi:hypothetical protein